MPHIFDSFDPPDVLFELDELPLSLTSLTADVKRLVTIFLTNSTTSERTVTITNTAGKALITDYPIPANAAAPALQFPFMYVDGLKWVASGAGVLGQVETYDEVEA
jgi:hypothetical protein